MTLPLHDDGCIVANIRTNNYKVSLTGQCPHTKIMAVDITVKAETAAAAAEYVLTWSKLPQTVLVSVTQVP